MAPDAMVFAYVDLEIDTSFYFDYDEDEIRFGVQAYADILMAADIFASGHYVYLGASDIQVAFDIESHTHTNQDVPAEAWRIIYVEEESRVIYVEEEERLIMVA